MNRSIIGLANVPAGPRYAIYFVPSPSSVLYRFGAELIGYDAYSGGPVPHPPDLLEKIANWHDLTEEPRRYGFHATLKAPITLAEDVAESCLIAAIDRFAKLPRTLPRLRLKVSKLGSFIALTPDAPNAALSNLADDCVREFDVYRAPLSTQDRERRLTSSLTPNQIAHLDRWGYPYVFDEFRFHMTLTGRLPAELQDRVLGLLEERFGQLDLQDVEVSSPALLCQSSPAQQFRIIDRPKLSTA